MKSNLLERAQEGVLPKRYRSKIDLTRPLTRGDLDTIIYLITTVYSNENVVFTHQDEKYTATNLLDFAGKTGKLEIAVGALEADSKSEGLRVALQRQYNLDAEDCAEGLKEYIDAGFNRDND